MKDLPSHSQYLLQTQSNQQIQSNWCKNKNDKDYYLTEITDELSY